MFPRSPAASHDPADRSSAGTGAGAERVPTPSEAPAAKPQPASVGGLRHRLDDACNRIRIGSEALGRRTAIRLDALADRIAERIERPAGRRSGLRSVPAVAGLGVAAAIVAAAVALIAGENAADPAGSPTQGLIVGPVPVERPTATEPAEPTPKASTRPGSTEAQVARRRLSAFADMFAPDHEPDPRTAAFVERLRLAPPYGAVDSVVFDTVDQRFHLHGVWPVARDAICRSDDGRRLACGLMARAALQNHIAGKEVVCDRMFGLEPPPEMIEVRCRLAGEDLALRMIRAGWAFPSRQAGRLEAEALDEARQARRGWWNGPQTAPTVDPSIADAAATPFGSLTQSAFGGSADPAAATRPDEPASP